MVRPNTPDGLGVLEICDASKSRVAPSVSE